MESSAFLWAKLSNQDKKWLPLIMHMNDSVSVASYLWDRWISESTKTLLDKSLKTSDLYIDPLKLIKFLVASHDLGKASPGFQAKASIQSPSLIKRLEHNGLEIRKGIDTSAIPHATVSMMIMKRNGIDESVSSIVGSHHGIPPSKDSIRSSRLSAYSSSTGFDNEKWIEIQDSLLNFAYTISDIDPDDVKSVRLSVSIQDILAGITIITDWLASNEVFFPLIDYNEVTVDNPALRSKEGCIRINFPHHAGLVYGSKKSFKDAFGFEPRAFQKVTINTVEKMEKPGLVVIEAPMGEGKTEAALSIAETLASKFGHSGLFFGLPTQATANGVFTRVKTWVEKCSGGGVRSITLAHGKSAFNDEYSSIPHTGWNVDNGGENLIVHQWFHGKTNMLSDIVVGTVDQVLMAGLKQRYLFLRHFGLAEKIVIIDECHAYDEYMGSYLTKALSWLGTLGVSVILISATLPPKRREEMIEAYIGHRVNSENIDMESYPMVTCVTEDKVIRGTSKTSSCRNTISIVRLKIEDVVPEIKKKLTFGGYAGVILNTVKHAQDVYESLKAIYPKEEVVIIHSAYTAFDRSDREKKLIKAMKRDKKQNGTRTIVVGTQVLEQSLDIDFDVMFSEICPIDLLLQRMGRLHRHSNERPTGLESPTCYVIDTGMEEFDKGTESVYGRYQLMNTRTLLKDSVNIPQDIPKLVSSAYSDAGVDVPDNLKEIYMAAKKEKDDMMAKKERKAKVYQICSPKSTENLVGWLDNERTDPQGLYAEATVRDTNGSVEVILVHKDSDGTFRIPGNDGEILNADSVPNPMIARRLSDCRIALPHRLVARYGVSKLIEVINTTCKKNIPKKWEESEWLSRELFQIIDDEGKFNLMGMNFRYDEERGLIADD